MLCWFQPAALAGMPVEMALAEANLVPLIPRFKAIRWGTLTQMSPFLFDPEQGAHGVSATLLGPVVGRERGRESLSVYF